MNRRMFIKLSAVSVAAPVSGCGVEEQPLQNPSVETGVGGVTKIFPAPDASFSGKRRIFFMRHTI